MYYSIKFIEFIAFSKCFSENVTLFIFLVTDLLPIISLEN